MEKHPARFLRDRMKAVYTAHSAFTCFMKHHICLYVLKKGRVPINPFMSFEYFFLDCISRDVIRRGNNSYIHIADELWTFGIISDGVQEEIRLAKELEKNIRHFSLGKDIDSIKEISINELTYEAGVASTSNL